MNKEKIDSGQQSMQWGLASIAISIALLVGSNSAPDPGMDMVSKIVLHMIVSLLPLALILGGCVSVSCGVRKMIVGAHEPATEAESKKAATPVAAGFESR